MLKKGVFIKFLVIIIIIIITFYKLKSVLEVAYYGEPLWQHPNPDSCTCRQFGKPKMLRGLIVPRTTKALHGSSSCSLPGENKWQSEQFLASHPGENGDLISSSCVYIQYGIWSFENESSKDPVPNVSNCLKKKTPWFLYSLRHLSSISHAFWRHSGDVLEF